MLLIVNMFEIYLQ